MNEEARSEEQIIISQLESYGPAQVRTMMTAGQWPTHLNQLIGRWLSSHDQESERLREASQAEQIEIARSAKDAAWAAARAAERAATAAEKANIRATMALIIAAISIIATIAGMLLKKS